MRALFTAASGMEAQQLRIDSIANNLANVNTTGYKKWRPEFQDMFYEVLQSPGATGADGSSLPTGVQVGHGVRNSTISRVSSQGDRVSTGQSLDLAIDGAGYFQVEKSGGETLYTRDGAFKRDRDGNMVTSSGNQLVPSIAIPSDAIQVTILPDGTVSAILPGQIEPSEVGQLELARFVNPAGMRALGGNLFAPTEASGDPETGTPDADGFGAVTQGFLEMSNVNVADELVQMILAQRAFETNSRVIQAGDEMMRNVAAMGR